MERTGGNPKNAYHAHRSCSYNGESPHSNSPPMQNAMTQRSLPRGALPNRNVMQIDENYFDHLDHADLDSSDEDYETEVVCRATDLKA